MIDSKHHWPNERCYYCGEPATKFCDAADYYLVDNNNMILTNTNNCVGWCDRPLCDEHGEQVGMTTKRGHVDSVDYCPKHMTKRKLGHGPDLKQA